MTTLRDRCWLWAHTEGAHNQAWGLPAASRMTPVEAAYYLGVSNLIMVVYRNEPRPPFDRHAVAMRPLKRVIWSIVGDSGSKRNDEQSDLESVLALGARFPNIHGAMMDDFFLSQPGPAGEQARYSLAATQQFRDKLHAAPRPLELWVVVYNMLLDRPIAPWLDACDVLTYWTWQADELAHLERDLDRLDALAPKARKVLGCYLWDYGGKQTHMPLAAMARQCELGRHWLKQGRIEGMIFLSNCVCDLELPAVEWTRTWLAAVGDERV